MTTPYRRLVFDLGSGTPDATTLRAVAALATALGVALQCVFIEDEAVLALAELPFAREYRLPTGDWTPIDATTIATELRRAAAQTQRLVTQALEDAGAGPAFKLLRGDPAACMAAFCRTDDILVLAQPGAPVSQVALRRQPALDDISTSALLLPSRFKPRAGLVAVVLAADGDPAFDVACRVAVASGENVLALIAGQLPANAVTEAEIHARAAGVNGIRVRRIHAIRTHDILAALAGTRESLLVMARASFTGSIRDAGTLAESLDAPVLLVDGASSAG